MKQRLRQSGTALVIVLASLAFLAALALAFLASVGTELKSSKKYADGISTQLLSQSAYNLAVAQITEATQGYEGNDPGNPGPTLAWASQPGMIRTYDLNGNPKEHFKLYSWDTMKGNGAFDPAAATEAISGTWYNDTARYVDLNQPLSIAGTRRYPILDGETDGQLETMTLPGVGSVKTYNLDSDTANPDIDGFYVQNSAPVQAGNLNPVPMPVKWLYVLEDGQIVAPSGGSGNTAVFSGASAPTADNPIVGRIAFWTDDESAKINVNTASEGVYWDTPRSKSRQEDVFKVNQPVNGEYQRYPGHPAMTCLSTVIKHPSSWNPGTSIPTFSGAGVSFTLCTAAQWVDLQWAQKLYGVIPRIGTGGSNAGSVQSAMLITPAVPPAMTLDADRLYATVDELLFKPDRTSNNTALANLQVLDNATLERAKFFLTASSRAPDVNLFNKPRVSIWPITLNASTGQPAMTAFDNLIAFCSTMREDLGSGAYRYYFQRRDPNSFSTDLPSTGGVSGLSRNRTLLEYLRTLTTSSIPGFGGNFGSKYGPDNNQILTEIFDYIRSTNLDDGTTGATAYTVGAPGTALIYPGWANAMGKGQVVPIVDSTNSTRGFGRYPTVQGASVLLIAQVDGDDPLVPRNPATHASVPPYPASTSQVDSAGKPLPTYSNTTPATVVTTSVPPGQMRIQAIFLPQFFCPSVGAAWMRQNYQYSVNLSGLTLNGLAMGFPAETNRTVNQHPSEETGFGDQLGFVQSFQGGSMVATLDVPKASALTLAGTVTIKIYSTSFANASPPPGTLVQTVTLNFTGSPGTPMPSLAWDHVANKQTNGAFGTFGGQYYNYRFFGSSTGRYNSAAPDTPIASAGGRVSATNSTNALGFIMAGDAIRSVRVASGDPRLVAARTNPPAALFEPNPETNPLLGAHSLFNAFQMPYYGAALGRLVSGAAYSGYPTNGTTYTTKNQQTTVDGPQNIFFGSGSYTNAAAIPQNGVVVGSAASAGAASIPGDWDNAPFNVNDGPYINKADEGDVGSYSATNGLKQAYSWKLKAESGGKMTNALFTPNRLMPSAVTFGSLPTGVLAGRPWQTLLFHPQPGHPGSKGYTGSGAASSGMPADHLLLDLFHMPVVEPYAISEPMSTAGRINMNYQIVPFTYINRNTGIRALLKSEKVISIPDSQASVYKLDSYSTPVQTSNRLDVNADETLQGFDRRFNPAAYGVGGSPDIFRSASEICELPIVPAGATYAQLADTNLASNYWTTSANGHRLTGDNSKERIYATLYPRLTTKSNTFTVHARVQTLKKASGTQPDVWTEGTDQILGEYRGSQTLERYIDPNNTGIPDYANGATAPLGGFYKTRILTSRQFGP
jgi:uncharacterized protein (TIGR02600 family)